MARRKTLGEEGGLEIPTSMVDVVFLLLIFFLIATRLRQPEEKLDAFLPKGAGQSSASLYADIRVTIDPSDTAGAPRLRVGSQPVMSFAELGEKLSRLHAAQPESPVILVGHPNAAYGDMVSALDTCAGAGIADVRFQAPRL